MPTATTLTPAERQALQAVVDNGGKNVQLHKISQDLGSPIRKTLHLRLKRLASKGLLSKKDNRTGATWSATSLGRRLLNGGSKAPTETTPPMPVLRTGSDQDRFLATEACPFCGVIGRLYFPDAEMQDAIECLTCHKLGEVVEVNGTRTAVIPGTRVKSFVAADQKLPCSACGVPIADGTRIYRVDDKMDSIRHVVCPEVPMARVIGGRKSADAESALQRARLGVLPRGRWLTTPEVIKAMRGCADCRLPLSTAEAPTSIVNYLRRASRTGCILSSDPEMRLPSGEVEWYVPSDVEDLGRLDIVRPDITHRPAPTSAATLLEELRKWTPRPDRLVVQRAQKAVQELPHRVSMKQLGPILDGKTFYLKQFEALTKLPAHTAKLVLVTLLKKKVITEVQWRRPLAYKFLSANEQPYSKEAYIKGCKALELQRHQTGEAPAPVACAAKPKATSLDAAKDQRPMVQEPENDDPPPPKGSHPTAAALARKISKNTVTIPRLAAEDEDVLAQIKEHEQKLRDLRRVLFKKHSARVAAELDAHFHEWAQRYSAVEIIVREAGTLLPYDYAEDFLYSTEIQLTND